MKPQQPNEIAKIVEVVTIHGYIHKELEKLLRHVGKQNLAGHIVNNNILLEDYISSTDEIRGDALTGLSSLFSFNRTLLKIGCNILR